MLDFMDNINENIAENITKLRKRAGMTQSDLADKLNYSDKAISKWERGENVPSIETLYEIAKIFDVNIEFLFSKHSDKDLNSPKRKMFVRNLLITIMLCVAVFLIATVIFIYPVVKNTENSGKYWVAFVAATPLCALIVDFYGCKENYWLVRLISISLFVWLVITTVYCISIILGIYSLWMLYLVGVPIQAAICLLFFWKKTF